MKTGVGKTITNVCPECGNYCNGLFCSSECRKEYKEKLKSAEQICTKCQGPMRKNKNARVCETCVRKTMDKLENTALGKSFDHPEIEYGHAGIWNKREQ